MVDGTTPPIDTPAPRRASGAVPALPARAVLCPRCDYDLAGHEAARPSDLAGGVCPECGLAFAWDELTRQIPSPGWSLEPEMPRGWGARAARALRVLGRTLRPGSLWQRPEESVSGDPATIKLMLAHPVLPGRVLTSGLASLAASWVIAAVVTAVLGAVAYGVLVVRHLSYLAYQTATAASAPAVAPRIFPRPTVWQYAEQLWAHLAIPGMPWTAPSADTQRIAVMTAWAMGTAALMPVCFLLLGQTMARLRVRRRHLWRVASYALPPIPMIGLAFSALTWTAALLESLRVWLSNARTAAVLRVEGYEWAHPEEGWVRLTSSADSWLYWLQRWVMREGTVALAIGVLLFIWLFWYRASSRYLRLPRAALDTLLLLVVGVLGVPTIILIISQGVRAWTGAWP